MINPLIRCFNLLSPGFGLLVKRTIVTSLGFGSLYLLNPSDRIKFAAQERLNYWRSIVLPEGP